MVSRRNVLAAGAGSVLALGMLPGTNGFQTQELPGRVMLAGMTGGQEAEPVDTDAEGGAVFGLGFDPSEVDTDTPSTDEATELHYALTVTGLEDPTMAHIHQGSTCESGEIVAWLYPSPELQAPQQIDGLFSGVLAHGIVTEDDLVGPLEGEDLSTLVGMLADGEAYVNVHTEANPGGELRGQILPLDDVVDQVDEWTVCPTGTPTETETPTEAETPTETPTETPSETPTETPTETPGGTPTETPTGTPGETPTPTPTGTPNGTPTETPTPTPGEE